MEYEHDLAEIAAANATCYGVADPSGYAACIASQQSTHGTSWLQRVPGQRLTTSRSATRSS